MRTEQGTIRLVITLLGLNTGILIVGILVLLFFGKPVPDALPILAGTGVGALGGMLSKTSSSESTQKVEVVNTESQAVPTTDEG